MATRPARLLTLASFANLSSSASTTSSKTSQRRMPAKLARHALAVSLLVLVVLGAALPSMATTFTVTDTSDNAANPKSLRHAVNHAANGDTINFSLTYPATITLTNGFLEIATNVTIKGPGAAKLFISGNNASPVFKVDSTVTGLGATISGVTIEDGFFVFPDGGGGGIYNEGTLTVSDTTVSGNSYNGMGGGGMYNEGTATVTNSTFSGNSAFVGGLGDGGGINNGGTLTVSDSTFSGNSGPNGGGISNGGTLTVSNSTFSGNGAFDSEGGGIFNGGTLTVSNSTFFENGALNYGGGIYNNAGTLTVSFSTFSGNVGGGFPNDGGGIGSESGTVTLKGTLLANESPDGNCSGNVASDGYNLSDDNTCSLTATGDQNDVTTAGLSPSGLQNNGGPTETIALLPTSSAVNAIPVTPINECTDAFGNPVKTDQRGVPRPQGPGCDIGAYELVQGQVTASPTSISFGNVELCRTKKVVLTLYNNSTTEAQIGPISFIDVVGNPADFYYIRYCPTNLYPAKSCTVAVMFRPDALTTDTATLSIVTSAPGNPIQVPITAAGSADPNCD